MVPQTSTWSPAPRRPPTRRNRRHSPPPTPIIPIRFASHSTIREAPTLATSPAYRAPRTAGPPSPASPPPPVEAPLTTPLATPLFCTRDQPAHGSRSGSTATGAAPWAGSSPLILWTRLAGELTFAFTPPAATTGNLAGLTITPPLRTSETCTFPGTTLT